MSCGATNFSATDAAYMEEIILQNEELLLEVEQLRSIVKGKGLDQLQQLRGENEKLRQQLKLAESQLEERTHQLEVLESAYNRFDGVNSAIHELTAQQKVVSEMREQQVTLEKQNAALKAELMKISQSEDEARTALIETEQQRQALEEEVTKLRASTQKMASRLEDLEKIKCSTEKALEGAKSSITVTEARAKEWEEKYEAINERLCETERAASEKSQLKNERHTKVEKELGELRETHAEGETKLKEMEEQLAKLKEELRVAKDTLVAKEHEMSTVLVKQKEQLEQTLKREAEDLKHRLQEKENSLRQQVDKNISLMAEIAMLQAENENIARRPTVGPTDVSVLKMRLKELSDETSKKDSLQKKFQQMLASKTATNSDIKLLFEQMLDYQEQRDEEMQTKMLICQIQAEDTKNMYELNLSKLRADCKSLERKACILEKELRGATAEGRTETTTSGGGGRDVTPEEQPVRLQYGITGAGNNGTPRKQALQEANANSPQPVDPGDTVRHGTTSTHGSGVSIMDDLWRHSTPRAERRNGATRHVNPDHQSLRETSQQLGSVSCKLCTYLNKPGNIACDVCGGPI